MYLLDTYICIEFLRGDRLAIDFIKGLNEAHISVITLAELFYGIYNSKNLRKHKEALANFLTNASILNANFSVSNSFGKIKSELKNKGSFIGDFDIMNAAFALAYDFVLVTRNVKHYSKVDQLKIQTI